MPRLLLLRHGQSTWNAEHRWQGWADPPLSDLGKAQALTAALWLAAGGEGVAGLACSDLWRARRTAEILAEALGLDGPQVEPALRERDIGDWTGLTTTEIEQRWPDVLADWRAGRIDTTPGAEAAAAFLDRVAMGVRQVAAAPLADRGPMVVITHGGVVRTLERALGVEPGSVANLSGRWVEVTGDGLRLGASVVVPGLAGPPVAAVL